MMQNDVDNAVMRGYGLVMKDETQSASLGTFQLCTIGCANCGKQAAVQLVLPGDLKDVSARLICDTCLTFWDTMRNQYISPENFVDRLPTSPRRGLGAYTTLASAQAIAWQRSPAGIAARDMHFADLRRAGRLNSAGKIKTGLGPATDEDEGENQ